MRFSQDARQRAEERITFTVYDDFGRVISVGEADTTFADLDPERSYAFERDNTSWRSRMYYDAGGIAGRPDYAQGGPDYAQGRLSKVEENTDWDAAAEVAHRYAYDHLGNVRVKRVEIDGLAGARTVAYVHDLAGRVNRLTYPDGSQARYAYDGAGRLSRMWDERGKTLARYTHTAAGNIDTHTVGNIKTHLVGHVAGHGADEGGGDGIATGTFTYNAREWVTGIDYPGRFTVTQTYDVTGNVTSQRYRRAAPEALRTASYAYDRLHRLTYFNLAGAGKTRRYEYDRNGNLSRMQTNGANADYRYSDSANPNRVSLAYGGGLRIWAAYNENGWVTSLSRNYLTYDYRGLLTGHGIAAYTMDPDRRRVKKTAGTSTTYYLRGADGSVLAEYDGSQAMTARYVYAGSRRIARIAGGSASYYLADHLGSTRSLVGEDGSVTAAYDYWPYGKVLASSGDESTHFRFTGHERDAESSLDYMLERAYAFNMGRFLRPDPMQDEYPGISPYAYAANNPLKYVDPDGRAVYSVNRATGEILRVGDKGGNKTDYFNIGTTNDQGGFDADQVFSSERGLGSIHSFRFQESNESTISAFVIPGEDITGFFLEPAGPSTTVANQKKRIPEGTYQLEPFSGKTHKNVFRLSNDQVSKTRNILIHIGNYPFETRGCLMAGCSYAKDEVKDSGTKLRELRSYLNSIGAENVQFKIYNILPEEEQK